MLKTNRSIAGLDLIRFAAAAAVMWFHLSYASWASPSGFPATVSGAPFRYPSLAPTAWFGWVGVETFFVLSGFVIAFSAERKSPFAFLRSRFLRLYPAVWACVPLTLVALLLAAPEFATAPRLIRTVTLLPFGPWLDGVYWTLGIEMVFYAVVFCALLLNRFNQIGVVAAVLGMVSTCYWLATLALPEIEPLSVSRVFRLTLIPHGCFFAIGCMIWLMWSKGRSPLRLALCSLFVGAGCIEIYSVAARNITALGLVASPNIPVLAWLTCVGLIIASLRWHEPIGRVLARYPVRTIGLATYPLYLLHDAIGAAFLRLAGSLGFPAYTALGLSIIAVVTAAVCTVRWGEPRIVRLADALIPENFLRGIVPRWFLPTRAVAD